MAIPVVLIEGWSGSGKSTLIEALIPIFKQKGVCVGVLKHDVHGVTLDKEGKDTWRFSQAGADTVAIAGPNLSAVIINQAQDLHAMLPRIDNVDLILVEGFEKHACLPMIEVWRDEDKPFRSPEKWLRAVVSDTPAPFEGKVFRPDDARAIADFILDLAAQQQQDAQEEVHVALSGAPISMTPFVQNTVTRVIRAVLSTLHGYEDGCDIDIHLSASQPKE